MNSVGSKFLIFFWVVLFGSIYHLVRDILQILGVYNLFTEAGHWEHEWCGAYCDYVTLPLDIFLIATSLIVIRNKRAGIGGILIAVSLLLIGMLMWFWK